MIKKSIAFFITITLVATGVAIASYYVSKTEAPNKFVVAISLINPNNLDTPVQPETFFREVRIFRLLYSLILFFKIDRYRINTIS